MVEFIVLTGYINSGKSTTAKNMAKMLIKDRHSVAIKSFATPLKELASLYFNYNEDTKTEQRGILERLSVDLKSLFGQSLFAYTLLDECDNLNVDYVIIDDLRYKEEFDIISEFFPTTVIVTPTPKLSTIDPADATRIKRLIDYFDSIGYEYVQMKSLSNYAIKDILYGLD